MPVRRGIRILLWSLLALIVVFGVSAIWLLTVPAPLEAWLQDRVIEALREHYHREVQLENLRVTLIPEFEASADNFVLPNPPGRDLPPLIVAKHFVVKAGLPQLFRRPVHLGFLRLDGLVINVPAKGSKAPGDETPAVTPPKRPVHLANFSILKVYADGAVLYVLRKDPKAEPMEFDIRKLTLQSAGIDQPMTFKAELTNPKPPGMIESTGHFGPWNFDDPGSTRLSGHYTFADADLSVFNGISGILSSVGDYSGMLNNIVADGTTDTPDFQLDRGAAAVRLTTRFHAIIDGTNGNTYLQPVDAHFLKSHVIARGEVASKPGDKGKTVSLDIDVHDSYLQDMLQLANKSTEPALTGHLEFTGHVTVPPGKEAVLQKLRINGNFHATQANFTSDKVRNAVAELSQRGQGKPKDQAPADVPAEFAGDFRFEHTVLNFEQLQFVVPGAAAQMKGSYGLSTQQIDFLGDVRLQATVSQVVGGKKGWALKPFDPIFMKHNSGTFLPVQIAGTRERPEIKVQWKKLF